MSCWVCTKNRYPNATPAKLDVVAFDGDFPVPAISVDLPFHGVDIGDGRVIEVLAPDEGRGSRKNASPAAKSPAQGRALMRAARSQFWPRLS